MPDMIVLVGCNHDLQRKCTRQVEPEIIEAEAGEREQFGRALQAVFQEYRFDFVGEEINHGAETIPCDLAAAGECRYV